MIKATANRGVKGHAMSAGKQYDLPADVEALAIQLGFAEKVEEISSKVEEISQPKKAKPKSKRKKK